MDVVGAAVGVLAFLGYAFAYGTARAIMHTLMEGVLGDVVRWGGLAVLAWVVLKFAGL